MINPEGLPDFFDPLMHGPEIPMSVSCVRLNPDCPEGEPQLLDIKTSLDGPPTDDRTITDATYGYIDLDMDCLSAHDIWAVVLTHPDLPPREVYRAILSVFQTAGDD